MHRHARYPVATIFCALLTSGLVAPACASPALRIVVAMDPVGGTIQVIDPGSEVRQFDPFGPSFRGGVRVAVADVDGDGMTDVIAGSGAGMPATVRVFTGRDLEPTTTIRPFGDGFRGGVVVAAGDVDGDGRPDIIVGTGAGNTGTVKIHDGRTGLERGGFDAFASVDSGVRLAAGDVDGDGVDEIIVGAGQGGGPVVRVFDGRTGVARSGFVPGISASNGRFEVAAGDYDGDGLADFVLGADGPVATPSAARVMVLRGTNLAVLAAFDPYGATYTGGVRVAAGDVNGDGFADVLTATAAGGTAVVSRWLAPHASAAGHIPVFGPNHDGGTRVAAAEASLTIHRDSFESSDQSATSAVFGRRPHQDD